MNTNESCYSIASTTKDHRIMETFVHVNDSIARKHLARNPHIPFSIVKKLATDSNYLVRYEIWLRYEYNEEIELLMRASSLCYAMKR